MVYVEQVSIFHSQVYWFKFIVRLLIKILVYKETIRDERDYEEEDESNDKKKK